MRNNIRILGFLLSFCLLLNFTNIYAQLEVTQESDAEKLAKAFVGIGLEVSNATLTCPEGGSGFFNGEFTNLGINEGIALCSGTIDEMPGPNDESGATGINTCVDGDQDLNDIIIGFTTNDACILEFDFIPYSENLSFNYVFGSEEYLEYVGSSFNDVFAFFIEGPGVPFQNIALIPGTTVPVSINNLNDASNSEYYVDNGSGFPVDPNSTVQYDGLTVQLQAKIKVTPCETYHLKLAIADAGDCVLDSGVFLEAGSLNTDFVEVLASTVSTTTTDFDNMVEGCVDGKVKFVANNPVEEDLVLSFEIAGTATEGEDYVSFPKTITIPAGQQEVEFIIDGIEDGLAEGAESIVINFNLPLGCDTSFFQTATLNIEDLVPLTASADQTLIEPGTIVTLSATGGSGQYKWMPSVGLGTPNEATTTAIPLATTTYTVQSIVGSCILEKEVTIFIQACSPETDPVVGTVSLNETHACAGDIVAATTNGTLLQAEDALAFYLHNNPDSDFNAPGFTLYDSNLSGNFANDGSYPYNTTLYITAIAADSLSNGYPDLADQCISISPAAPIVFLQPIEPVINAYCDYSIGLYTVVASFKGGYPQYDNTSTYEVAGNATTILAYQETVELSFQEAETFLWGLTATDVMGCQGAYSEEVLCIKTPLDLLTFSGKPLQNGNQLDWATATEQNIDFYTLKSSANSKNKFETIAQIEAKDNTTTNQNDYQFIDIDAKALNATTTYYQLFSTDALSGQTQLLATASINRQQQQVGNTLKIAAITPLTDGSNQLLFNQATSQATQLSVYDVSARQVVNQTLAQGITTANFTLPNAGSSGVYFVTVTNGQQTDTKRFVR